MPIESDDKPTTLPPSGPLARIYSALNTPIVVTVFGGLLVFLISVQVQSRYWIKQQQFLIDRARIDQNWLASRSAQQEIVKALGKRLAVTASLITAHKERDELKQHLDAVIRYDNAMEEWDEAREIIKFQMAAYFQDPEIQGKWDALQGDLEVLHQDIQDLEQFVPANPSKSQDAQADKCDGDIGKIETDINDLNKTMTAYAVRGGR